MSGVQTCALPFSDKAGHRPYYSDAYPTLVWPVSAVSWCDDCRDEHDEGDYKCIQCSEIVVPGFRGPSPWRSFEPGLRSPNLTLTLSTPQTLQYGDVIMGSFRGVKTAFVLVKKTDEEYVFEPMPDTSEDNDG